MEKECLINILSPSANLDQAASVEAGGGQIVQQRC